MIRELELAAKRKKSKANKRKKVYTKKRKGYTFNLPKKTRAAVIESAAENVLSGESTTIDSSILGMANKILIPIFGRSSTTRPYVVLKGGLAYIIKKLKDENEPAEFFEEMKHLETEVHAIKAMLVTFKRMWDSQYMDTPQDGTTRLANHATTLYQKMKVR
jgi:hypothetical protein